MAGRPKTRAKAGGRKPGVQNKRKNAGELLEFIKRELRSRHYLVWPEDWDPVARMAVIAEKHFDSDPYLALAALKEVTRYLRAPLQSAPLPADDEPRDEATMSAIGAKFDALMKRCDDLPAIEDRRDDEIPVIIDGTATEVVTH